MKSTTAKHENISRAGPGDATQRDPPLSAAERLDYIATAAYYKAEARGFEPGQELDDWLSAEAQFKVCEER